MVKSKYIGKKFGKLTVIDKISKKVSLFSCLCDCGNYTSRYAQSLISGESNNCGCDPYYKFPLLGKKFNKLTVIEELKKSVNYKRKVKCLCDCGNTTIIDYANLQNGHTKSCGCLSISLIKTQSLTHGKSKSKEYKSYRKMLERCNDLNDISYKNYGGRGIKVCDSWSESFENFYKDMGDMPTDAKYSLDRIDPNGNYEPANCRWADYKLQGRNRTNNHWIEYKGKKMVLQDWVNLFNINQSRMSRLCSKKGDYNAIDFLNKKLNYGL